MSERPVAPSVSVIMGVRNVEPFIGEAVGSVLNQTWTDWELIIVNDGSTDGTRQVLGEFTDERIRIVDQTHKGSARARNAALALARGEFIAFLDGDDRWRADKLEAHVAVLRSNPEIQFTFSDSVYIDETGRPLMRPRKPVRLPVTFESLLLSNGVGNGSCVVLRTGLLRGIEHFDPQLPACIDHDLWLRAALASKGAIQWIPAPLTDYRRHTGQITGDWRRMEKAWFLLMDKMQALAPAAVGAIRKRALGGWYRYLAYVAYEAREPGNALRHLKRSIAADPARSLLNWRTWVIGAAALVHIPFARKRQQK